MYGAELNNAIAFMDKTGEVSLIKVPGEEPMVRTRQAIECLLAMPKRAHLVHASLKAFIEGTHAPAPPARDAVPPVEKPPKPSPVRDRVIAEMMKFDAVELAKMGQEAMASQFNANRETCRLAREEALKEMSANVARQ